MSVVAERMPPQKERKRANVPDAEKTDAQRGGLDRFGDGFGPVDRSSCTGTRAVFVEGFRWRQAE